MIQSSTRRRAIGAAFAAVLAAVLVLPTAASAAPGGAITWTVDHANKTITVNVRLEIYSGCGGNPEGTAEAQAVACRGVASQVTQFLADKIKAQIESIWNKPYYYRCYRLIVNVDVKLAPDASEIDPDRIAVQIDPSPAGVRNFVANSNSSSNYASDSPADKVDPTNNGKNPTTWSEEAQSSKSTYAHEFGHILGLSDTYHDVTDPNTGKVSSEPYPDVPDDLMSTFDATNIAPATIERVVLRNFPVMHDTDGNTVSDADLKCDLLLTIDNALLHQEVTSGGIGVSYDLYVTPDPDAPITLTMGDNNAVSGTSAVKIDGQVHLPVCTGQYHGTESIDVTGSVATTPDGKRTVTLQMTGPPDTGLAQAHCPSGGGNFNFGGHGGFAGRWATLVGSQTLTIGDPPTSVSKDGTVGGIKTHVDGDVSVADASPPP